MAQVLRVDNCTHEYYRLVVDGLPAVIDENLVWRIEEITEAEFEESEEGTKSRCKLSEGSDGDTPTTKPADSSEAVAQVESLLKWKKGKALGGSTAYHPTKLYPCSRDPVWYQVDTGDENSYAYVGGDELGTGTFDECKAMCEAHARKITEAEFNKENQI